MQITSERNWRRPLAWLWVGVLLAGVGAGLAIGILDRKSVV